MLFDIKAARPDLGCDDCGLYQYCRTPKMGVQGNGAKRILLLLECPTPEEDKTGELLRGQDGGWLRELLAAEGVDVDEDCWVLSAANCRPRKRTPSAHEIDCCREEFVRPALEELRPRKVLVFGPEALRSVLDNRIDVGKYERWEGHAIPDQQWGTWIHPLPIPGLVRAHKDDDVRNHFRRKLVTALDFNAPFPELQGWKTPRVLDERGACAYLRDLLNDPPKAIAFDYETNCLNPRTDGARVLCVGIARLDQLQAVEGVSFPHTARTGRLLARVLADGTIRKVAQNLPFEESWSALHLSTGVRGWEWDTMVESHLLDNRSKAAGLKFQTYVQFGVAGYDADVDEYIRADATGFNRLHEVLPKAMKYCALDAYFTAMLYLVQSVQVRGDEGLTAAHELFHAGHLELTRTSLYGWAIDEGYFASLSRRLGRRIARAEQRIHDSDEARRFFEAQGRFLKPNSPEDVGALLTKVLGRQVSKRTGTGKASADEEELRNHQEVGVVQDILKLRKLTKMKSTYVDGVLSSATGGFVHPQFHLHIAATYRSSSSDPNIQNIPKRDAKLLAMIRRGFVPRPGRLLCSTDYSGVEVRVSACCHQDPQMIKYIEDPTTDMHRDQAEELFCLPRSQITKPLRHLAKNGFVFAEFYGSYYRNIAPDLWARVQDEAAADGTPVLDYLARKGVRNYDSFEKHVRAVEDKFWSVKFRVFGEWKEQVREEYERRGWIRLLTGFRIHGPLTRNETINYHIQGPAFHLLLWSVVQLGRELRERKMGTRIVGQIHDDVIAEVVPEELDEFNAIKRRIMCEDIRTAFPWLIVPLEIETEVSAVNGNWSEMKELK